MSPKLLPRRAALAAAALALAGCGTLRESLSRPPEGLPSGRDGWLVYQVEGLRFEAPAAWRPSGSARHLTLEPPESGARLEVSSPEAVLADQRACLAAAEELLARAGNIERARRHPTTFAGVRAITLEGDSGGWHVWAWAACDGGRRYQVFFTARTPASPAVIEALRTLGSTARVGGEA
jgi:hypothetical protein